MMTLYLFSTCWWSLQLVSCRGENSKKKYDLLLIITETIFTILLVNYRRLKMTYIDATHINT